MRHLRLAGLAALSVLATAAIACNGLPGTIVTSQSPGAFTADVDGVGWTATSMQASRDTGIVTVTGHDAQLLGVALSFPDTGLGTYSIGPDTTISGTVTQGSQFTWTAAGTQGNGLITITALSATRVVGTFAFTATLIQGDTTLASRIVSNGVFSVTY